MCLQQKLVAMQQFYYYLPKGSFVRMLASKFPQTLVHTQSKIIYKCMPIHYVSDTYCDDNMQFKIIHSKQNDKTIHQSTLLNLPEKNIYEKTKITVRTDTIFINYAANVSGIRFIGSGEVLHHEYSSKFHIQSHIYDIGCNRRPDEIEEVYKKLANAFGGAESD